MTRAHFRARAARHAGVYAVLILGSAVIFFPIWWMFVLSLATPGQAQAATGGVHAFDWWPADPQWQNYTHALKSMGAATAAEAGSESRPTGADGRSAGSWTGFLDATANTVVITALCIVGQVLSCSLVGFAFARLRFRGRGPLFILLLSTMMLPVQVTMIPLFLLFRALGWIDTILPLTVPAFFGTAFFIFMFRQFFAQVPEELLEAARIDGAGSFGIWWRLMLPICRPVVAITAIFTFIWTWNDFMGPLIYLHSPENFTLALALHSFKSQFGGVTNVHLLMAASVVTMIPCVIVFFATQRHFVRGLNVGGIKG